MASTVALARLYFALLAIFVAGRFLLGVSGVPYEQGTFIFSLVVLTLYSSFFYGAFCRRWLDFRVLRAMQAALLMGLASQLAVLACTLASYALGLETYFNHPRALNAPGPLTLWQALAVRLSGLVANTLTAAIAGALGWALGALLPPKE